MTNPVYLDQASSYTCWQVRKYLDEICGWEELFLLNKSSRQAFFVRLQIPKAC